MMDSLPKSQLLQFAERAIVLTRRAVARFSTRYSRKRFTLRQHVVLLCLKVKKTTYRDLVDETHRRISPRPSKTTPPFETTKRQTSESRWGCTDDSKNSTTQTR
jgi:hypothetical protein